MAAICDTFHSSLNGTIGEGKPHTFNSKHRLVAVVKVPKKKSQIQNSNDALDQYSHYRRTGAVVLVCVCLYV